MYWPTKEGEPVEYGRIKVTLQSEATTPDYTTRKLHICNERVKPSLFILTIKRNANKRKIKFVNFASTSKCFCVKKSNWLLFVLFLPFCRM